jgi:type I restriction enzyme M protein
MDNKFDSFSAKEVFLDIRNYLAGRFVGATKDDVLLHELVKMIFCNKVIKDKKKQSELMDLSADYRATFDEVKNKFPEIFDEKEQLLLDPVSMEYVHNQLLRIDVYNIERDPIGDAYEIFMGENIKGQSGQFFTPKNAADALVKLVNPKPTDKILDFACGAGGFLIATINYFVQQGYSKSDILKSIENFHGIDKDSYLITLAKIHIAILYDKAAKVVVADSLEWKVETLSNLEDEYDFILSNPPYGAKIKAGSKETLMKYRLGYKWKKVKDEYVQTNQVNESVPPQIIFVEQAINKVKVGGKIGLVVPESLISSKKYSYVVKFIEDNCEILSVIGMPENLFKTSGKGGTHTKTALIVLRKRNEVEQLTDNHFFLAEAKWCGNDSRGKKIDRDDIPAIIENYRTFEKNGEVAEYSTLGFSMNWSDVDNYILSPRYYNPAVYIAMGKMKETHEFVKIKDMIEAGEIEFKTGDEVGKMAYGTGNIPFVRTSDISNWEIKTDPKQSISEDIFNQLKLSQDIQVGDILMVKDGTYLIGSVAIITEYDLKMVYQSHLYKIRLKPNRFNITPYYLLVALSSEFVQSQIKAKTFTQDIIDSLGDRYKDITLPIQKDREKVELISKSAEEAIFARINARETSRKIRQEILV